MLVTMVFWGQMTPSFVLLLQVWDPFALSAARYVVAAPFMMLVLLAFRGSPMVPTWAEVPKLAALGIIGMGGLITCYAYGLAHSNPVTAIVVQTASPLTYTAIARFLYGEPVPSGIGTALCLVIPGGLLLATPALMGEAMTVKGGEIFLIFGSACWAWYSLQCRRWLPHYHELRLTTWTMITAAPFLIGIFLVLWALGATRLPAQVPPLYLNILLLWLVLTSTCLGIMLWHSGVSRLGVATAGLYFNIAPLVAMAISSALGYVPTPLQLAGALFVLAGIGQLHVRRWLKARRVRGQGAIRG
nr:DMT family transporter [Acuticoccus mangrovi]